MMLSLPPEALGYYIETQLANFFPDKSVATIEVKMLKEALDRTEYCFSKIKIYSHSKKKILFNHLHSDQYLTFLWYLSNQVWVKSNNLELASKIYYLNKALHSFDCLYDNKLPDVFYIAHGIGIVLGKARYSNYLYVCKGVTVGTSRGGKYPILGEYVSLGADSTVIGKVTLGCESAVGAGVTLFNKDVPSGWAAIRSDDGKIELINQRHALAHHIFKK